MTTLFERFKKSANDAISDYSQLKDAYPNVKNFGSAVKKSISAHIPSNEDFQSPERMSEWAQSAALNAPMLGTFTGPKSLKWDKEKAAMAAKLLDEGVNPAQVWKDHLIGRLPSGHLFSEIDDSLAKAFPNRGEIEVNYHPMTGHSMYGKAQVGDISHHPELYKNYPDLEGTGLYYNINKGFDGTAAYHPNYDLIEIQSPLSELENYLLHEHQHQIQLKEGWPQGGSPVDNSLFALDVYLRLTGEAQARATQNRMNMTMAERRANYPMADDKLDDVPLGRLIDRYGNGE